MVVLEHEKVYTSLDAQPSVLGCGRFVWKASYVSVRDRAWSPLPGGVAGGISSLIRFLERLQPQMAEIGAGVWRAAERRLSWSEDRITVPG